MAQRTARAHLCNAAASGAAAAAADASAAHASQVLLPFHPRLQSYPRQVTPTFFSDRVPTISPEQSQELVATLTRLGGLNATGYTMPGVWVLPTAVQQLPWLADGLVQGAVVQQLRIAAGDHENMGEWVEEGAWCCWKLLLVQLCCCALVCCRWYGRRYYCTRAALPLMADAVATAAPATARPASFPFPM